MEESSTMSIARARGGGIEELPTEIIQEILSRLPIYSLFDCRYVYQSLRNVISDRHLAFMHYTQSCRNQKQPTNLLLSHIRYAPPAYMSELYYIPDYDTCEKVIRLKTLPFPSFTIVGSCNGFVCLGDNTNPFICQLFICNPVNGDLFPLPDPPRFHARPLFEFGYVSSSNEYKVIAMGEDENDIQDGLKIFILTVGTSAWRNIGYVPFKFTSSRGTFFHDYLHWATVDILGAFVAIKTFDFRQETFGIVPLPHSVKDKKVPSSYITLGMMEGCLLILDNSERNTQHVWVMKEYGVKKSWILEFVLHNPCNDRKLDPLAVQKNGNVLLACGKALYSYDPKTEISKELKVHGLQPFHCAIPHVGTLVTLKDAISMDGI